MIAHKIRIYPNQTFIRLFDEQFDYARHDYNRQLELLVHGIESNKVNESNLQVELDKIWAYCASRRDFFHPQSYHWPDIVGWNIKRLSLNAKSLLRSNGASKRFKKKGRGKAAFKIYAAKIDSHRFEILPNKRLSLMGFGEVKMAESPRFSSRPISVEISLQEDRYFASFLFDENHPAYPKSGKAIGVAIGTTAFAIGSAANGETKKWDVHLRKKNRFAKKIRHETTLLAHKFQNEEMPSSKRFQKNLKKLKNAYFHFGNIKTDFIHKTCHDIAFHYDVIGVESPISARASQKFSAPQGQFQKPYASLISHLIAKGKATGKIVYSVKPSFPFSQICHYCGKKGFMPRDFKVRKWVCPYCGSKHNRDENAATNILREALHAASPAPLGKEVIA